MKMKKLQVHLAVRENSTENYQWLKDISFDDSECTNEEERFFLRKQLISNELQKIKWMPKNVYFLLYEKDALVRTVGKKNIYHICLKDRNISAELQVTEF